MSNAYGNTERGDERLLREMRKEIESLRRKLAKRHDWQPISTAPKDGTRVLLHAIGVDSRPMIAIARWACSAHSFSSIRVCGTGRKGPCEFEWLGGMGTRYGVPFTHWLPLPEPPQEEGK